MNRPRHAALDRRRAGKDKAVACGAPFAIYTCSDGPFAGLDLRLCRISSSALCARAIRLPCPPLRLRLSRAVRVAPAASMSAGATELRAWMTGILKV